jgi:exodeoxyribonuclease III
MTTTTLSIATWNVNSIRSRLHHLLDWLRSDNAPDVVCLQELKVEDAIFPAMEIEELGYNIAIHGQKTYNGVAILSKYPLEDVLRGLPGNEEDEQARYIEALVCVNDSVVRVASVYVPNGQAVDSDKFQYKMRFYDLLKARLDTLRGFDEVTVIGGDYNVAPQNIDVYDPASLEGTVCFHPREREKLRNILNSGYYDAFRICEPEKQQFSWWDYRGNGWKMNKGLRIDHLLLSPKAVDCMNGCDTLSDMRDAEKASDHAPVVGTFTLKAKTGLFAA